MTIASAFNDIAVAQGGTASKSGTIAGAIDALNDALAGSDQQAAQTIEAAVRLLGEHIGGGGSSVTVEALTATENKTYTAPEGKAYSPVTVDVVEAKYTLSVSSDIEHGTIAYYAFTENFDPETDTPITESTAGEWIAVLAIPDDGYVFIDNTASVGDGTDEIHGNFPLTPVEEAGCTFIMPAANITGSAQFTAE